MELLTINTGDIIRCKVCGHAKEVTSAFLQSLAVNYFKGEKEKPLYVTDLKRFVCIDCGGKKIELIHKEINNPIIHHRQTPSYVPKPSYKLPHPDKKIPPIIGKLSRGGITRDIKARQYNQRMFLINKAWNCLSNREKSLLNKKYDHARSLETGKIKPETEEDKYFVKVCQGQVPPLTDYQEVYLKYLKIRNKFLNIEKAKNVKNDKQINNKISINAAVKEKSLLEKQQEASALSKRRENAEAAYRMAQKQLSHEKGIPEYEEGTLRSEWGTRGDHMKMRARDWGDMQKRRKE